MRGLIFSVEELALFDGSGIRVNVFFKGCPLRCQWCHNPEGWEKRQQVIQNPNGCIHCGLCRRVCPAPTQCTLCKECLIRCPKGLRRISGQWVEADVLAERLKSFAPLLIPSSGGLTFSGGEVLMQADFLCELLKKTAPMHRTIETSGYGDHEKWRKVLQHVDHVYYDLKIMDEQKHMQYTGVSNRVILENAKILFSSVVPYTIRVPFIHGVNTDAENLNALCAFVQGGTHLEAVELLPYNTMAGAKYTLMGLVYANSFEPPTQADWALADKIFHQYSVPYRKEL